jgi:transcriptional regulator with XRE-family HTH domain
MEIDKLKNQIGANIAFYRKQAGLTQAGLAEKLNYSDKAVSKWERGESVPDVLTLAQLAEQFEITVNDLLSDPYALPGNPTSLEAAMTKVSEKTLKRKANKRIIQMLSSLLVWFVALFFYVILSSFEVTDPFSTILFAYAIPSNAIVLLSLRSAWRDFRWNKWLISTIVWGFLFSFHVTFHMIWHIHFWKIYLLGIPGQMAILLWFKLFSPAKHVEEKANEQA